MVPKAAFICHRCGEDEAVGGSFHCVVWDWQILSVLQTHVVAMLRPGMNAPRVDFAMNVTCAVRHASPRRVIRNRVRAKPTDVSALTRAESEMWPLFAAVANGMLPAPPSHPLRGPPRTATENKAAALWAASPLVNTFFKVKEAQPARVAAAAAGIAVGEDGKRLDVEEEDVLNLFEASDSEDGQGGGGQVHRERRVAGTGTDSDGSCDDSDGGRRAHVDEWVNAGSQRPAPSPAVLPHAPRLSPEQLSAAMQRVVIHLEGTGGPPGIGAAAQQLSKMAGTAQQSAPLEPAVRHPSFPVLPVPPADTDIDELAVGDAPCTAFPWLTTLTSTAVGMGLANAGENFVVVNSVDPTLTPTQAALKRTQAIADETEDEHVIVIVTIDNVPLDLQSFRRTLPNQWYADEVINGYVNLLRRRQAERRRSDTDAPRLWFFNTFFYWRMHVHGRYDYHIVSRWCGRLNLLTFNPIFMPIDVANTHWVLAVMHPSTGVINIYDSLNNGNEADVPSLLKWADDHARDVGAHPVVWHYEPVLSRRQENSDDCGMLMVTAMDCLARDLPL